MENRKKKRINSPNSKIWLIIAAIAIIAVVSLAACNKREVESENTTISEAFEIAAAPDESDNETELEEDQYEADEEEDAEAVAELDERTESAWSAGELEYLGMSRKELLQIYKDFETLLLGTDIDDEEPYALDAYEDECAEQIATKYGISSDDVITIYLYGGTLNYFAAFDVNSVELVYADSVEVETWGTAATVKVYVSSTQADELNIEENYSNVCDFIRKYAGTDFDTISYLAVGNSSDGEQVTVISFTVSGDVISTIATESTFDDSSLEAYVSDLYILPST